MIKLKIFLFLMERRDSYTVTRVVFTVKVVLWLSFLVTLIGEGDLCDHAVSGVGVCVNFFTFSTSSL